MYAVCEADDGNIEIWGFLDLNISTMAANKPQITNGSVTIPLWEMRGGYDEYDDWKINSYQKYSGNHTTELWFEIRDRSPANIEGGNSNTLCTIIFDPVTFSNGNATKSWNEGTLWN